MRRAATIRVPEQADKDNLFKIQIKQRTENKNKE